MIHLEVGYDVGSRLEAEAPVEERGSVHETGSTCRSELRVFGKSI